MPRYRITTLAAASLGLSLLGPPLSARQPGSASPGSPGALGSNLPGLVAHPAVQAELKLTDDQKARLRALGQKDEDERLRWLGRMGIGRPGAAAGREAGRAPAAPEAEDPFAAMLEARQEIRRSTERSIARILSPAQQARARQIQLQVEGPEALLRPEMQERLFLAEDQVEQIRALILERRQALRDARRARGAAIRKPDEDPEARKQRAASRARDGGIEGQFQAALHSKILNRRQSRAYRKMLGDPFDPTRRPVGAGPVGDRGDPTAASRPASGRGATGAAGPGRRSLRERRGLGPSDGPRRGAADRNPE